MLIILYITLLCEILAITAYSNKHFTIKVQNNNNRKAEVCTEKKKKLKLRDFFQGNESSDKVTSPWNTNFMPQKKFINQDPYLNFRDVLYKFLFGDDYNAWGQLVNNTDQDAFQETNLLHYPTGRVLRNAELFNRKKGVHLPISELMDQGSAVLNITQDYMQTAVDAFNIFVKGNLDDIKRLPADYVLNSARTISMLMISQEKLSATWSIMKGNKSTIEVTYEMLERYRPLFKYLGGKEMAKLNLSNPQILNFIGTHPDLNRHQVGMVASKYIKLNKNWAEPRYLNAMNNLLCGVPITYMREIQENTYLQLSPQVFFHTRACDPIQRRFYLGMMTRTQALGKAYSWNAQDVSRLGLLLADVEGRDLSSIKPEALAGLTAQVVKAMLPENLEDLTEVQLQYIGEKAFNILSNKLKRHKDQHESAAGKLMPVTYIAFLTLVIDLFTVLST